MYEVRGREDAGMTSAQRKHSRVKRWTKSVNLFEKEFIIFPICEGSHWFLIVAILPRLATLPPDSAARIESASLRPAISFSRRFTRSSYLGSN